MHQTGIIHLSLETTLASLLILLGISLVVTARTRGGRGLYVLGIGLTIALASTSSLDVASIQGRMGDRRFVVTNVAGIERPFNVAFGDLRVDLQRLTGLETARVVIAKVGVGDMRVTVPDGLPVVIYAHAGAGHVQLFDNAPVDGTNLRPSYHDPGYAEAVGGKLTLQLEVGVGSILVARGSP